MEKKKIRKEKRSLLKKMEHIFWNNEKIDKQGLKTLLNKNNMLIINIDEETSIQNFNEVIKIFKSKGIKKIFINVKHLKMIKFNYLTFAFFFQFLFTLFFIYQIQKSKKVDEIYVLDLSSYKEFRPKKKIEVQKTITKEIKQLEKKKKIIQKK